MKTLIAKFMPLNIQLLLLDDGVVFLCFKMTCFHHAESQANGEQKKSLTFDESIKGKVDLGWGVPGKTIPCLFI